MDDKLWTSQNKTKQKNAMMFLLFSIIHQLKVNENKTHTVIQPSSVKQACAGLCHRQTFDLLRYSKAVWNLLTC